MSASQKETGADVLKKLRDIGLDLAENLFGGGEIFLPIPHSLGRPLMPPPLCPRNNILLGILSYHMRQNSV